ncbi:hypothetical protein OGAPHI_007113 [Ogataea philodendri]|uniref:Uncharacterized protein n=1 Tax=Ogataea philodendri TaxID=1378263 RepID=A0A9P8NVR0_9ASCO|nr:uncharacterized protein OGAPHI_007113 [Ogataea philodendri]KAH3660527.1 hypothetical protein OGAPHI_007113 [Ogataea philodendri]
MIRGFRISVAMVLSGRNVKSLAVGQLCRKTGHFLQTFYKHLGPSVYILNLSVGQQLNQKLSGVVLASTQEIVHELKLLEPKSKPRRSRPAKDRAGTGITGDSGPASTHTTVFETLKIEEAASAAAFAAAEVKFNGVGFFFSGSCDGRSLPVGSSEFIPVRLELKLFGWNGRFPTTVLALLRRLTLLDRGMSISMASPFLVVGMAIMGGGVGADPRFSAVSAVETTDGAPWLSDSALTGDTVSETWDELFVSSITDSSSLEAYSSYRSANFKQSRQTRIFPG